MKLPITREKADWIKVLEAMYEKQIVVDPEIESGFMKVRDVGLFLTPAFKFYDEVEPEIDGDIEESLQFLESIGLIEINNNSDVPIYGLTEQGFQVAHQRKMERRQWWTNVILSLGIIVFSALTMLTQIQLL